MKELYKQTFEEFKSKNPELIHLSQEMLKFHYDGHEKIRLKTINRVKNERKKIIKSEEEYFKKNRSKQLLSKSLAKIETEKKRIKMIEDGKKSIELVKKRQRLNIETFIEEQINKDLMMKTHMAKDRKIKALEEENLKEMEKRKNEKEKKVQLQEQKRQE